VVLHQPVPGEKGRGQVLLEKMFSCPKCSVEQTWADACPHVLNPIGYFFDMDEVNPFLVLQAFNPMTPSRREEWGQIKMLYLSGVNPDVHWIQQ
jgi:hypothetical protein